MNRRRGRLAATVELAPLIDIVFLLLIFFMVSATFIRRSELHIDLPEANGGWPETSDPLTITVRRDGGYAVNGQPTAESALAQALASARGEDEAPRAVIAADALAPHQAVVGAMDAAGQSGLTRISILTREVPLTRPLSDGELPADAGASGAMPPETGRDDP
ncbi:MAG: biopolymer transporter ExbD [Gammaproteobacteria bacterium]|nr:biopolymer transporter ExbD [Gammaproteobacteria bacterium]MYF12606.1 biopolymer transporter ExbD [Gammaproteobacteria bacterium]MYG13048.1 biopolymer transporter ExbD [Gammaproteobacteria bacterium]MYK28263.1 biopolymer transporter ExbD [Gammaproteobacteria bacterium]